MEVFFIERAKVLSGRKYAEAYLIQNIASKDHKEVINLCGLYIIYFPIIKLCISNKACILVRAGLRLRFLCFLACGRAYNVL